METQLRVEWLTRHGGELRHGPGMFNCTVLLDGSPQYQLTVVPAKGKSTCAVVQTVNGKRLDKGVEYPDEGAALVGGLDELRQVLGW
jgi:hypothetical protein